MQEDERIIFYRYMLKHDYPHSKYNLKFDNLKFTLLRHQGLFYCLLLNLIYHILLGYTTEIFFEYSYGIEYKCKLHCLFKLQMILQRVLTVKILLCSPVLVPQMTGLKFIKHFYLHFTIE